SPRPSPPMGERENASCCLGATLSLPAIGGEGRGEGATQNLRLGIFAKTFGRPSVEAVFDAVASHGFNCVQFNFACAGLSSVPEQIPADLPTRIADAARARNLEIAAVSGTFNMIHP